MATPQIVLAEPNAWVAQAAREASQQHPLTPLTSTEIRAAAHLVRSLYIDGATLYFKHVSLAEPPKTELAPYLEALYCGQRTSRPSRRACVTYYIQNTVLYLPDLFPALC